MSTTLPANIASNSKMYANRSPQELRSSIGRDLQDACGQYVRRRYHRGETNTISYKFKSKKDHSWIVCAPSDPWRDRHHQRCRPRATCLFNYISRNCRYPLPLPMQEPTVDSLGTVFPRVGPEFELVAVQKSASCCREFSMQLVDRSHAQINDLLVSFRFRSSQSRHREMMQTRESEPGRGPMMIKTQAGCPLLPHREQGHGSSPGMSVKCQKTEIAVPSTMTADLRPRLTALALPGAPFSGSSHAGCEAEWFEL